VSDIESKQDEDIQLQIIDGSENISQFAEHWDDLFARAVNAPPFLSRPWISTYVEDGYRVNRVFVACGFVGRLIAMYYYLTWRLAAIEWLHFSYRRMRMFFCGFREKQRVLRKEISN
jgi:hypothetical protein